MTQPARLSPPAVTPELIEAETKKWAKVVKFANIRGD